MTQGEEIFSLGLPVVNDKLSGGFMLSQPEGAETVGRVNMEHGALVFTVVENPGGWSYPEIHLDG